jgi:type I restriction enzyme M protein
MINKQQLGNTLWGMAEILYGKVEDYKTYILSLLFFKRLSDNYPWEIEARIKQFKVDYGVEPNAKQRELIISKAHDFIIPDGYFWNDVKNATAEKKNARLDEAVNKIADANPALKGIINSVRWNEPAPDGSGGKRIDPELLTQLINYLDAVRLDNGNTSPDVLGDAYEYLIKKFADENKGGKTAGQFYTPPEVVEIIVRTLKPEKGDQIYDPTCGSGGFLINAAKYVREREGDAKLVRLFGQETVWNTWAIANINMILHGLDGKILQGDTVRDPKFRENGDITRFDLVMANFPFSVENWWGNGTPKKDAQGKAVLKKDGSPQLEYPSKDEFADPYNRLVYGIPPFSNGDFMFIQHIVASIKEDGRAGVVCPQGVLFRGQPEKTEEEDGQNRKADDEFLIRRGFLEGRRNMNGALIEQRNIIEAIVALPPNLFYGTTIPAAIIFFNKNKPAERKDKVLMVYAAWKGWYKEEPNLNRLLPHDVLRITVQLEAWGDIEIARKVLPEKEARLNRLIDDRLAFDLAEIDLRYTGLDEEIAAAGAALEPEGLSKPQRTAAEKRLAKLQAKRDKWQAERAEAEAQAAGERAEIVRVREELLDMFADPEKRKRYFSVVDMAELEENEFNLNLPRYVDTFEPEEDIRLEIALADFEDSLSIESDSVKLLLDELRKIKNA